MPSKLPAIARPAAAPMEDRQQDLRPQHGNGGGASCCGGAPRFFLPLFSRPSHHPVIVPFDHGLLGHIKPAAPLYPGLDPALFKARTYGAATTTLIPAPGVGSGRGAGSAGTGGGGGSALKSVVRTRFSATPFSSLGARGG